VKKVVVVAFALALSTILAMVAPAMAAKPTVVPCAFTASATPPLLDPGKVWWTGDGTILHVRGLVVKYGLFMGANLQIGSMEMITDMDFNTETGEGNAVREWTMTFIEPLNYPAGTPANVPNPYGIGTLEGREVGKVTSVYALVRPESPQLMMPGDYTGLLVATHGTGDFEKAKLMAETVGAPFNFVSNRWTERIRVGWNGVGPLITGELTFHE